MKISLSRENVLPRPVRWTPPPERREAHMRADLRRLGLRLEKSRRRSVTHEDYAVWTVLDRIGNGIQFKTDSHEETLDLIEGWLDDLDECSSNEEWAAVLSPCIAGSPELPSPGTIVSYSAEVADETRAAALTALATVLAARATALSGADEEIEEMAEARTKTPDKATPDKVTADALWRRLDHRSAMEAFSSVHVEDRDGLLN